MRTVLTKMGLDPVVNELQPGETISFGRSDENYFIEVKKVVEGEVTFHQTHSIPNHEFKGSGYDIIENAIRYLIPMLRRKRGKVAATATSEY